MWYTICVPDNNLRGHKRLLIPIGCPELFPDPDNPPGDLQPVFAEEPDCFGKCDMFLFEDAIGKIVFIRFDNVVCC